MPSHKWSIKVSEDKAYVFVNGIRHSRTDKDYLNVLRAEKGEFKNRVAIKVRSRRTVLHCCSHKCASILSNRFCYICIFGPLLLTFLR
jgi:hypothetical protein